MNENQCSVNIYLDFSKAFDSLIYDILLSKLKHYGIQENALQLLSSYLKDRSQYVHLDNVKSSSHAVICGIPQSSVLGPLLSNIYINDITEASTKVDTSARPEVRGTADVGWRSLNPLPINPPRTHSRLYHHMCLRIDGR